jgi:hypothetical protein
VPAEQITKWSVMTMIFETSSTTMSVACLSAAARAAAMATSRLGGSACAPPAVVPCSWLKP